MTTKRKPKARTAKPPPRDLATFSAAAVDTSQVVNRWTTRARPDLELVGRALTNTVYSACNLLATTMASQTLRLYRPQGSGKAWGGVKVQRRKRLDWLTGQGHVRPGSKALANAGAAGEVEEVLEHPALQTLWRPMPGMTCSQWTWLLYFWQEAVGRGYVWTGKSPLAPTVLYLLGPQYVNVVGSKSQLIAGYRYGRDSTDPIDLDPQTVIYFRERVHPSDPLGASTWVTSIVQPADMEAAALTAEIVRWQRGGFPGGVIVMQDKPDPDKIRQRRADFESAYRGVSKAGTWMLLSDAEVVPNAVKPHELGYKDGLTLVEERVYRAAGIPESIWKLNDANRASAVAGDPQFMGGRILPSINALADKLTEEYLPRFEGTEGWWFAYDNPVAEDRAALVLEATSLADKGIVTRNESRTMLGLEPGDDEGLDEFLYNGRPILTKAESEARHAADLESRRFAQPGNEEGGEGDAGPGAGGDSAADRREEEPGGEKALAGGTEGNGTPVTVKASEVECHCGREHVTKDDDDLRLMREAQRELADNLQAWYDREARRLVGQGGAFNSPDLATLDRILQEGLAAIFRANAMDAMAESGADIGQGIIDAEAAAYARERAAELMRSIPETLRQQVRNVVADGLAEGRTIDEIRANLETVGIAENRTETVVRTEVSMASQGAARRTYEAAGWEGKRWDLAGGPCPLCEGIAAMVNEPVPIGEPFVRAGTIIAGTDGKAYLIDRDLMDGNAHPNCRCGSVYVEVMPEDKP